MKLIGAILIFFSCSWMGIMGGRRLAHRCQQINDLRRDLTFLEMDINYAITSLPEAFEKLAMESNWPLTILWERSHHYLSRGEGYLAQEAWQQAVQDFREKGALKQRELAVLHDFGSGLGLTDRQEQLKKFRLVQEQLAIAQKEAEDVKKKNQGMWRTMGVLGGLALVILLF